METYRQSSDVTTTMIPVADLDGFLRVTRAPREDHAPCGRFGGGNELTPHENRLTPRRELGDPSGVWGVGGAVGGDLRDARVPCAGLKALFATASRRPQTGQPSGPCEPAG
jgi:hypothetical protein